MTLEEILSSKSLKPKDKTMMLSDGLLSYRISVDALIAFARNAADSPKATCMEALEYATKENIEIGTVECIEFAISQLNSKAPRVVWESSRLIANIAAKFPEESAAAILPLLKNTKHPGTVVRWSTATALVGIAKIDRKECIELRGKLKFIANNEKQNSIKKIYLNVLKK